MVLVIILGTFRGRSELNLPLLTGGGGVYDIFLCEFYFAAPILIIIAQSLKVSSTKYLARS